jgi:hypothetical protein
MPLDTSPRLADPDGLFEALVAAHRGLEPDASRRLDARLVLLLANHIGDQATVLEAIATARRLAQQDHPMHRHEGEERS